MDFTLPDLLAKAFERSNALQTYWTFYATSVLSLLAFFGSKKRDWLIALFVMVAFLGFSLANLAALRSVTEERLALQALLEQAEPLPAGGCATPRCQLVHSIAPSTLVEVTAFHAVGDLLLLVGVCILVLRPERAGSEK